MAITIFSWGYFGWGNASEQLVHVVDTVERDRRYAPPLFVDIRIRRSGRAVGFIGSTFEGLLGPRRHRWIQGLGNRMILANEGGICISEPATVGELLDLAEEDTGRRVIFFCSCQWPMQDNRVTCHRREVANLLLAQARRRSSTIEVVEWPGGEPSENETVRNVELELLAAVRKGRASVPLGTRLPAEEFRGLAWGSVVRLRSGRNEVQVVAGPARYRSGKWVLPVMEVLSEEADDEKAARRAAALRKAFGMVARTSDRG